MNEFKIGTQQVAAGHLAWIRKVHQTEREYIKGKGGVPIIYPTKADAKAAAGEAIVAYINGHLTATGYQMELKSEAEAIFKKGRRIPVETKRKKA